MRTAIVVAVVFACSQAYGQPLGRSQLEELTGQPYDSVKPLRPAWPEDAIPPGWTLGTAGKPTIPELPRTVELFNEPGGSVPAHAQRFQAIGNHDDHVKVWSDCASACTLVISYVKKQNLCFGPDATLKFHQARFANGESAPGTTEAMYNSYPADVRAYIDSKGGWQRIPYSGWMYLDARELWKMGYKKCSPG